MEHFKILLNKGLTTIMLLAMPFIDVIEQWVRISAGLLGCLLTVYLIRQGIITWKVRKEELATRKLERRLAEEKLAELLKKKYLEKK